MNHNIIIVTKFHLEQEGNPFLHKLVYAKRPLHIKVSLCVIWQTIYPRGTCQEFQCLPESWVSICCGLNLNTLSSSLPHGTSIIIHTLKSPHIQPYIHKYIKKLCKSYYGNRSRIIKEPKCFTYG